MDWLEIVQTVGICLNSIFLLAITYMLFTLGSSFLPPTKKEIEEMMADVDIEDDDLIVLLQDKSQEEIESLLKASKSRSRRTRRKK